jgi:hypothetical protein
LNLTPRPPSLRGNGEECSPLRVGEGMGEGFKKEIYAFGKES